MEPYHEPTLGEDGWELDSALDRHRRAPSTFWIPDAEERANLRTGDLVKLLFLLEVQDETGKYVQCERMWVTVTETSGAEYRGVLESLPRTSDVVQPGALIAFGPDHIADIIRREAERPGS